MSVSIAMIPVALALRVFMGKERFEEWVESNQEKVATNFTSEIELVRSIKLSGYDAIKYGNSIKTHLNGEKDFFFWEKIDGVWHAIFYRSNDAMSKKKLVEKIENTSKKSIFLSEKPVNQASPRTFPTNFNDQDTLIKTLNDFGANNISIIREGISCRIEKTSFIFSKQGDGPFEVKVTNSPDLKEIHHVLTDLDDDYKHSLQTENYNKIKLRASDSNLQIEHEEVLSDKTIVLTLSIN